MPRISRSRPNSWYRSWMVVVGENVDERDEKRREVAKSLQESVETHHYDSQTLEEIIQVLDHEILCSRPVVNKVLESSIHEFRKADNLQPCLTVLSTPWIDNLFTTLSDCLVRSISKSSHYERELQSRSLISALALLRAQKVESQQTDHYDLLRSRFKERFHDLQLQRKLSGPLTREIFRHFQCSYLLCAGAEYAKMFERARPPVASVLSRAVDVALLGISITMAAQGVQGIGRLPLVLEDLNRVLSRIWLSPNQKYQELLDVQDITRVLTAFHLYGQVISEEPPSQSPILNCSRDLAKIVLGRILELLAQCPDFERTDGPEPAFLGHALAFLRRGPPDFSRYFYLYGLLDCATQIARVIPLDSVGMNFKSRMELIIRNSKEPSYRWKAIEFLLCDVTTRTEEAKKLVDSYKHSQPNIKLEIDAIRECLNEEEGVAPPQRDQTKSSPKSKLLSSDSTLSEPPLPKLLPGGWIEQPFSTSKFSMEEGQIRIAIKRWGLIRIALKRWGLFAPSPDSLSATLSPDCESAIFFTKSLVRIFSMSSPNPKLILEIERPRTSSKIFFKVAVASSRFVAIVTNGQLVAYEYGTSGQDGLEIGTETFNSGSSEWPWGPNCAAIHETTERTWIAVGGCGSKLGQTYGSIRMYRVDGAVGSFTLTAQTANFARQDCFTPDDPLSNDFLKMICFSPDGGRLLAVTNNNRVLVWFLSNNRRPRYAPFEILKEYTTETKALGMLSATFFHSPSNLPYVICTTSPSTERWKHGGEWSFISAVGDSPHSVSRKLEFHFLALGQDEECIVAGAASPGGKLVALLNQKGEIKLFTLRDKTGGGLHSTLDKPVVLKEKLAERKSAGSGCLRFQSQGGKLFLFAIDHEGKVIKTEIRGVE